MPTPDSQKTNFETFADARAQAAEYLGFLASHHVCGFEIPHQSLLSDEAQTRIDRLRFESESWDRHPDVLNEDGTVKTKGVIKEPNRKDGELVESYEIQQARAVMGDQYEAFTKAGGRASDISLFWWKNNVMLAERRAADSKSDSSDSAVAPLPAPDPL